MNNKALAVKSKPDADALLHKLAHDIASDMFELQDVLRNHTLSELEYERIKEMPKFQSILVDKVREWNAVTGTQERVKAKAAISLEYWLPELSNLMAQKQESMSAKIEGAKLLARLAGIGEKDITQQLGEKFTVQINLGGDTVTIDKAMNVTPEVTIPYIKNELE